MIDEANVPAWAATCFDCHANGHTNAATHLVGDIRPQEFRHRIDTPTLRGVHVQRLFGSQRALKSVEDFTEFEQRAAYFDGDIVTATKKGINVLDRGSQVHPMAEFQALLDFLPAPKLNVMGQLDPNLADQPTAHGVRGTSSPNRALSQRASLPSGNLASCLNAADQLAGTEFLEHLGQDRVFLTTQAAYEKLGNA